MYIYVYTCIQCNLLKAKISAFYPFPPKTSPDFLCLQYKSFKNTVRKCEITRNERFLLFPTVFSTHLENFLPFSSNLKVPSSTSFSLEESKKLLSGRGLKWVS